MMCKKVSLGLRIVTGITLLATLSPAARAAEPIDIGDRRELFVDRHLIDKLDGARLKLHTPRDAGKVFVLDRPWEGFGGYPTMIQNDGKFQLYYRGKTGMTNAGNPDETTCYAESTDGIRWTKPNLGLFEVHSTRENNVILDNTFAPVCSNFGPFVDTRPGVPVDQRYKALGGTFPVEWRKEPDSGGLMALVSPDGIHWKYLATKPVIDKSLHPARNCDTCQPSVFWSQHEQCYVCYVRVWKNFGREKLRPGFTGDTRWIGRTTSPDFINWEPIAFMEYTPDAHPDQLYLPNTQPYVRAPHIYVAITARLSDHRLVITPEQAKALGVPKGAWRDTSDAIFMTSRGGLRYDRPFMSSYLRPGPGPQNWVTRCTYPVLGVVRTGPDELSIYVERDNAQATEHIRRYTIRLDGFASVHAPYQGGEVITRPLRFDGNRLQINMSTSASGWIRCEVQDESGTPLPGLALGSSSEMAGDEIERTVTWKTGSDLSRISGKPVRLRFVMKDADVYSFQFTTSDDDR